MNKVYPFLLLFLLGSTVMGQTKDSSEALNQTGSKVYNLLDSGIRMPEFPGGEAAMYAYIGRTLKYPALAFENEVEGKVIIEFVIREDGSVSDVRTLDLKKLGWGLEEEAMRVISSMPPWQPASKEGKPVSVRFRLPIKFEINNDLPEKKKSRKSKDTPKEEPIKSNPPPRPNHKPQNPNSYD